MKVFCKKCKHSKYWAAAMGCCGYHCKVNKTHHVTAMKEYYQLMNCKDVNMNNDCKQYKPNWITSLSEKFNKVQIEESVNSRHEILDL